MSRMNKRPASLKLLKTWVLFCLGLCMLLALTPITDIDFDGSPDSFLTEGLLLILAPLKAIVPVLFKTRVPGAYLASPRLFAFLIVPPPIII
jgi:hypothetical protein